MKKLLSFAFCIFLVSGVWANGQQEKTESGDESKHLTISFGYWQEELFGGEFDRESDKMIQYIEDRFNVTIEPKFVTWADFTEKYRLWAAAGELPDFFATDLDKTTYQTWITQGVLRALPEDLSAYPQLEALFNRPDISYLAVEDQFYHIPRLHSMYPNVGRGIVVRKDWMEKLNISDPTTWDEFRSMLNSFVTEDPDGNNVDDTVGLMVKNRHFIDGILVNFNPAYTGHFWVEENGRWIPRFMSEKMTKAVVEAGKLYNDKLLYEDFILLAEANPGIEKFAYGTAGTLLTQCDPPRLQQLKDNWEQFNPDKPFDEYVKVLNTYPFPDSEGVRYNMANKAFWSSNFFSASVDDEKMGRILEILDFLNTDEGYDLWYRGLEGVDYNKSNNAYENLRPKDENGNPAPVNESYPSALFFGGMAYWGNDRIFFNADEYNYSRHDEDIVEIARSYAMNLEKTSTLDTSYKISELGNEFLAANKFGINVGDDVEASIMSENASAEWARFIDKYKSMGIEKIITDFNAKIINENLK